MNRSNLSLMTFNFAKDISKRTMTIQSTLQLAAETGLSWVDVMRVEAKDVPEYREAMDATGVHVLCYISCVTFFAKEEMIRRALDRDMAAAQQLGARLFMIVPYYQVIDNRKAKKLGREQVRALMVNGFRLAVQQGARYGLKVCFETTPADEICLSGTEDCRFVLDQVPELGLVFDTANMLPHGDTTMEAYTALKDRIVHALIYSTKRQSMESDCDVTPFTAAEPELPEELQDFRMDIDEALRIAKETATPSTVKGIQAIQLMSEGYTSREIGEQMNASAKLVCAWVSKARKFLKTRPEIAQIAVAYHLEN